MAIVSCPWTVAVPSSGADGSDLHLAWSHDPIRWAEPVTLEVRVRNPTNLPAVGEIAVTFGAPVLILDQSAGSRVRFRDPRTLPGQHAAVSPFRRVVFEARHPGWPPRAERSASVTFVPIAPGLLKIYARATFFQSDDRQSAANVPASSGCRDPRGFPARCQYGWIWAAPEALAAVREASGGYSLADPETVQHLQRMFLSPDDERAWSYFGLSPDAPAARLLRQHGPWLRRALRSRPENRDRGFLDDLFRLLRDPSSLGGTLLFGTDPDESPPSPDADEQRRERISEVENHLADLQGGLTLLSLIAAEADISLADPGDSDSVVLSCRGQPHRLRRGPGLVVRIIEIVIRLEPPSRFLRQKEEVSGYSYLEVLSILGKEST